MNEYCYCDFEPFTFYRAKNITAKKQHRCTECRSAIQPGEKYERASGKFDGFFKSYKTCCRCIAVREYVKAHVPCFCFLHEGLYEDGGADCTIKSYQHEVPGMGMEYGRLRVAVKRAAKYL